MLEDALDQVISRLETLQLDRTVEGFEVVESSAGSVPAPVSAQAPTVVDQAEAKQVRKRFYTVIQGRQKAGDIPAGIPGVYNSFQQYANQVCAAGSYPFTGRGGLVFAPVTISQGFVRVSEAEDFWQEHFPGDVVPRQW